MVPFSILGESYRFLVVSLVVVLYFGVLYIFLSTIRWPTSDMTTTYNDDDNSNIDNNIYELRIPILENEKDNPVSIHRCPAIPYPLIETFQTDGFVVFPNVLSSEAVDALNDRLEEILRGNYNRGQAPDKMPRLLKGSWKPSKETTIITISEPPPKTNASQPAASDVPKESTIVPEDHQKQQLGRNKSSTKKSSSPKETTAPLGFSGKVQNVKVLQVINVHKSDVLFRSLATSWQLGHVVAHLAGWNTAMFGGTRLGQDQIWAKPPGSPPLVFHRDSPYFMFAPSHVVTVWVALDDMDAELGPLEYVKGSHTWGEGRVGSANQFFQSNNPKSLLYSAAEREGIAAHELELVSMAGLPKGSISIHDGRTWHGSGRNESRCRPRRGLGLHFIPANSQLTPEAAHSRLWRRYVEDYNKTDHQNLNELTSTTTTTTLIPLSEEDFPITWTPHMFAAND